MDKGTKSCWYVWDYINANCIGELLVLEKGLYVNAPIGLEWSSGPTQISELCSKCAAKDKIEKYTQKKKCNRPAVNHGEQGERGSN